MSLVEVAKRAGVSPSTVSRAINRPESLTTEKLVAVQKAMTAMNYTPLPPAKRRGPKVGGPGSRKSSLTPVGLWCVGLQETQVRSFYSSQLELLHFAAAAARMELKLMFSDPGTAPREILGGNVAGFILQGAEPTASARAQIAEIPHVWLMSRRSESWPGDYVEPDNEANGRMAADWLAAQKARRWVAVCSESTYPAFARRIAAFLQRADELGLSAALIAGDAREDGKQSPPGQDADDAEVLAQRFLALWPRADGIYLPGHGICGPFFRALRQQGKDPAAFQTILGHYSPPSYDSLDPQPAVIDINLRAIVRHAVAQLADRLREGPVAGPPVGLCVAPVLRETT